LVLRLIVDGLRGALSRAVGRPAAVEADPGESRVLEELAQRYGPDGLLQRLERCLEADVQIDRRVQLVLVLEAVVDALA